MTKDIATVKAALECTVEHLEGEHDGKVVVNADVFNALYDFAETALSSPPAIDLAEMKRAYLAYQEECEGEPQDYKKPFIQGAWSMADYLAATGKLGGDDLGELLKRVPEDWNLDHLGKRPYSRQWVCTLSHIGLQRPANGWIIVEGGDTPAEAVRKAMEKMEEGE